jgi:Predicted ATPase (AAA+ superfamily)
MKNDQNPFLLKGYISPELFCNRVSETERLVRNIQNGANTLLISNRRMGKTSLILHTFHTLNTTETIPCLFVDISATENITEFTNQLASAMLHAFPEKTSMGKKVLKWIKGLRPIISYDPLSGTPQVSIAFSHAEQAENSLTGMFRFMEQMNIPIVIAFDEFQQIRAYPEKNIEALLRTHVQHLHNLRFIFSGSSKHILSDIFADSRRPFFASTEMIALSEIDYQPYFLYIENIFKKHRRTISSEAIDFILLWSRRHTYYTQSVCNHVFAIGGPKIGIETVHKICSDILAEQEALFYQYRQMLTPLQWKVLQGIAHEDKLYQPNSKMFLQKNRIGTPSNVQRAMDALLRYEMIYREQDNQGSYYQVYDVFLSRWLENKPNSLRGFSDGQSRASGKIRKGQ